MSIKVRMTLLLGLLLAAFLGVMQFLRHKEQSRIEELRQDSVQSSRQSLQQWISLTNQPLQRFARDFSEWPEMAAFLDRRDQAWAESTLKQNLVNYEAHALWVLTEKGELVYSAQQHPGPPLPPPATSAQLAALASGPGRHIFAESRDGLLEAWGEPIGSDQPGGNPRGWLLVSRWWSPRFLATLSRLSEMRVELVPAGGAATPAHLLLPLCDLQGRPLRQLQTTLNEPDFAGTLDADTLAVRMLLLFGLLVIATVWLGVRQWVLRPLAQISRSLAHEDASAVVALQHEDTELGRIAQLVAHSFEQKQDLRRENEERKRAEQALRKSEELVRRSLELRARLARDLHDGVIQSIYAAGLGLESAMSELERDQAAARTRLTHCRQSLNGVIREVRGFISGLEPEQMQRHGFAEELGALARTMQALWPVRIVHKVDAQAAARLNIGQEVHALQIARECISNALRHGEAKKVLIMLAHAAGDGVLTVRDDGRGFEPALVAGQGSGLHNLATRAREMGGRLHLDSQPGRGATVTITFPLAEAAP
ncbi:Signal transduction histidine kinase [Opitutus sp. GAS368]|nr:Signal transduction histidine kinase [Opitutus sp. GAS368]